MNLDRMVVIAEIFILAFPTHTSAGVDSGSHDPSLSSQPGGLACACHRQEVSISGPVDVLL